MSKIKITNKITALQKQQKEIAKKIVELKNKEDKKEKKIEEQKKIIIGSYFLNKYKEENKLEELNELLDKHLTKKRERKLFNLKN
jgi:hypothetical protein